MKKEDETKMIRKKITKTQVMTTRMTKKKKKMTETKMMTTKIMKNEDKDHKRKTAGE